MHCELEQMMKNINRLVSNDKVSREDLDDVAQMVKPNEVILLPPPQTFSQQGVQSHA